MPSNRQFGSTSARCVSDADGADSARMHRRRRRRRHGSYSRRLCTSRSAMTLPEVMVGVALSSIVMGVLISLAIALKQRDRAIRSFAVESERRCELAELLRTDIRRAARVSLPDAMALVVTRPDGGETRYELTRAGCKRTVADSGGGKPRFDLFTVGSVTSWSLEPGPRGRRPLFAVTLNRASQKADKDSRRVPLLVYAALGADLPSTAAVAKSD
jgi:hypothetical protein